MVSANVARCFFLLPSTLVFKIATSYLPCGKMCNDGISRLILNYCAIVGVSRASIRGERVRDIYREMAIQKCELENWSEGFDGLCLIE